MGTDTAVTGYNMLAMERSKTFMQKYALEEKYAGYLLRKLLTNTYYCPI